MLPNLLAAALQHQLMAHHLAAQHIVQQRMMPTGGHPMPGIPQGNPAQATQGIIFPRQITRTNTPIQAPNFQRGGFR